MTAQHTDAWLVVRVRDGDLEALGELYERYKTSVYRTALAITCDERAAEDILQDAFLRVYTYAYSIDAPLTWLTVGPAGSSGGSTLSRTHSTVGRRPLSGVPRR